AVPDDDPGQLVERHRATDHGGVSVRLGVLHPLRAGRHVHDAQPVHRGDRQRHAGRSGTQRRGAGKGGARSGDTRRTQGTAYGNRRTATQALKQAPLRGWSPPSDSSPALSWRRKTPPRPIVTSFSYIVGPPRSAATGAPTPREDSNDERQCHPAPAEIQLPGSPYGLQLQRNPEILVP